MYRIVTRAKNLDRGAETNGFQGENLESPGIALTDGVGRDKQTDDK